MFNELTKGKIMKKKLYNQPQMQVTALMPTTIVCVSAGYGGDSGGAGDGSETIDLP